MRKSSQPSQKSPSQQSASKLATEEHIPVTKTASTPAIPSTIDSPAVSDMSPQKGTVRKRPVKTDNPPVKRSKSASSRTSTPTAGQSTLKGFFKPKSTPAVEPPIFEHSEDTESDITGKSFSEPASQQAEPQEPGSSKPVSEESNPPTPTTAPPTKDTGFVDPVASKEDWSKLFTKKPPPTCEEHDEPCISLKTKKPGPNFGRSFWICPRPLGPSGNKEKGTTWRCPTFIWANNWDSSTM